MEPAERRACEGMPSAPAFMPGCAYEPRRTKFRPPPPVSSWRPNDPGRVPNPLLRRHRRRQGPRPQRGQLPRRQEARPLHRRRRHGRPRRGRGRERHRRAHRPRGDQDARRTLIDDYAPAPPARTRSPRKDIVALLRARRAARLLARSTRRRAATRQARHGHDPLAPSSSSATRASSPTWATAASTSCAAGACSR